MIINRIQVELCFHAISTLIWICFCYCLNINRFSNIIETKTSEKFCLLIWNLITEDSKQLNIQSLVIIIVGTLILKQW